EWKDWVSIFIAFVAVGLTLWSAYLTRMHNRLSVKPSLKCTIKTRNINDEDFKISYVSTNAGPGFAHIDLFSIYIEGEQKLINPTFDEFAKWLSERSYSLFGSRKYSLILKPFNEFAILHPNQKQSLIEIVIINGNKDIKFVKELTSFINSIKVEVDYHSIYNQKFHYPIK
ncbi:MAG: hypothetical protein JXR07_20255, partial [Reichenbachiella sp.]